MYHRVANLAPDTYRLCIAPDVFREHMSALRRHYAPISLTIETPLVLAIRPALPFRDLKGLITYAKSNPGKLNGSSPGPGTGGWGRDRERVSETSFA